jgi:plasmid replication initiation protein
MLNLTRQEFSTMEKHIFHLVLKGVKSDQSFHVENIDTDLPLKIIIPASDILKQSKNTEQLKSAIKKITSRNVYFDFSKPDEEYFGSFTPFTYAKYSAKKGVKSFVEIHVNYVCKKLFLELAEGYTNLELDAILNLKSQHSIRMYELISMYFSQKKWTISLDKLKSLLGLKPTQYPNFTTFKTYILEYSKKELWEHCNLHFEWEVAEKKGKKITALTFHIKERNKQERIELNEEIKQTIDYVKSLSPIQVANTYNMITSKYSLSQKQADYIFTDTNRLNEFIRIDLIIEDKIAKGNPPKDRTKYLAKSLGLDKIKFKESEKKGDLFG